MAYAESIKRFERIREYMREFYVYGFKSRNEYTQKSARSYDNERRRLESWLGGLMQFRQTPEGRQIFLSVDSRTVPHNPLYQAWKTKSFTDGEITLHFLLMDVLAEAEQPLSLPQIAAAMDARTAGFAHPWMIDDSTLQKKLKEYRAAGIVCAEKQGKTLYYSRAEEAPPLDRDMLDLFSEIAPCGVVGSYLLDKTEPCASVFAFKHHYITAAMDSEILCALLCAIGRRQKVTLETITRRNGAIEERHVVPLQLRVSVQSGRQYLMAYAPRFGRITSFRVDRIHTVQEEAGAPEFEALRQELEQMKQHLWGVSTRNESGLTLEHLDFTVRYGTEEPFIHQRLEREKRCGRVERLTAGSSRFSAEVYDASELIPWVRTFLCRIVEFHCSSRQLEAQFWQDVREMEQLYGLTEEAE